MKFPLAPFHALLFALAFVLAPPLAAQAPLSGNISDGAGGPLLSGVVYHGSGSLTVPAGTTLTVQAGAILKLSAGSQFSVGGLLDVQATAGNHAIFTSITDDSAGGDTPGDGATTGIPGYWRGIVVILGGSATVTGLETRFTGQSGYAALSLTTTPGTTVADSLFTSYSGSGINFGGDGVATVSGCSFTNGNFPVENCYLSALTDFTGNSASGNSVHNCVEVGTAAVNGSTLIPASSVMGGAHKINSGLTVGPTGTLTVEAGVVFKFAAAGAQVTINGTLTCNGSGGSPVVFTEFRDDAHGGDSNNDGLASSPAKGTWRGITFNSGADASVLTETILRYTGQSIANAITLNDADITLSSCVIEHGLKAGIDVNASLPIVTNCDFSDVSIPIADCPLEALPNFSGNTASNCTTYNAIECDTTNLATDVTFGGGNLIGNVLVCSANINVQQGVTLSVDQGAVLKFVNSGASMTISGTLLCDGSSGEIVFTTIADDSHGGDTNADGPSNGAPGQWRALTFGVDADASILDQVRVRYSGQSGYSGIRINSADISLTNSVIEDCLFEGLSLSLTGALPTVSNCAFDRCSIAVTDIYLPSLVGFNNNTATGNSSRNSIKASASTLSTNIALGTNNLINDVLEIVGNTTIDPAGALTLGAGVVVKLTNSGSPILVQGTLNCNGTSAQPVVFTDLKDDQYAGDTNLDGPSVGIAGHWRGLFFTAGSDASVLAHTIVRFSGQSGYAGVEIVGSSITMTDSTVSDCLFAAVELNATAATPTIQDCAFNSSSYSVRGARWDNLANFRDNTASGNVNYDSIFIEAGAIDGAATVDTRAMIGGAFVASTAPALGLGDSLTFRQGVIVKAQGALAFTNGGGPLNLLGTALEPVVFTSISDDEFGGDTNKDGPSLGTPGAWRGFHYGGSEPATVEYALIRYGGQSGFPGFEVDNLSVTLESVRVEHCLFDGFQVLQNSGPMDNLVAFDCGAYGVDLLTSNSIGDLRFATVTACSTGIRVSSSQAATIQSTICWGNAVANYSGVTASQLFDSNGDAALAGMNGNINLDPLFVDDSTAVGDLRLQSTSPCIDAGNFSLGMMVASDHIENSRLLDHDLDGTVGADMGAYEFGNWYMTVSGRPVLGETMNFTLEGTPAFAVLSLALLDYIYYYPPYGMVIVGSPSTLLLQDIWYVNYGYPILIPNDPFAVGYKFGVQMGAAVYGNLMVGNIANLYRGQIQD